MNGTQRITRSLIGLAAIVSIGQTISVVVEFARTPIQRILANSTTRNTTVVLWPILTASTAAVRAAEVSQTSRDGKIDRYALVARHNVVITEFDATLPRTRQTPLQVGNGHFAFGLDVTGLQTFMLQGSFSHATLSDWGWHTAANPENYRPEETMIEVTDGGGRKVPYAANSKHHWPELPPEEAKRAEGAWNYYRQNPGRLPLGQIRFHLFKADGKLIEPTDLKKIRQTLDLWTGIVRSSYEIEGVPVEVITCCHPEQDLIAIQVKSKLMSEGRLKVFWEFPAVTANEVTEAETQGAGRVDLARTLDADRYFVSVAWDQGEWEAGSWNPGWPRRYLLTPSRDADDSPSSAGFLRRRSASCRRLSKQPPHRPTPGRSSGNRAARSICRRAKTRGGANWNGGSCWLSI